MDDLNVVTHGAIIVTCASRLYVFPDVDSTDFRCRLRFNLEINLKPLKPL